MTYKTIGHPQTEYCGAIWEPYTKVLINKIEMIQHRAARFIVIRYHNTFSISDMIS